MSKEQRIERIYLATKEGRELHRIRRSATFNIGLQIMKLLKNPFRLFLSPYIVFSFLKKRKRKTNFNYIPESSFLIVGMDKTGEFYSQEANNLAISLQESGLNDITLLNNSSQLISKGNQIQWFRVPGAREINYSRKEWNIIVERLLASVISVSKPQHILFLGDYLYRGIINSLEGLPKNISTMWLYSDFPKSNHLNNDNCPRMEKICVPAQRTKIVSKSNELPFLSKNPENITFIVDLAPKSHFLFEEISQIANVSIMAVQRETLLPSSVIHTVKVSELIGAPYTKRTYLLIDDTSRLVPELPSIEIPSMLLQHNSMESPVLADMLRDMELYRDLVIVRRKGIEDIKQSIDYLITRTTTLNLRESKENYTVEWLKNQS